ncbi:hypothetical protein VNO80_20391 [Phaseolus coccineus]|uniref:Uncharacterized protein n=1 Tax=Phaseolus coccineus TaxID=3886 RepID=A0AAN9MHL7_PHACN
MNISAAMKGNKRVVRLISSSHPLEVNTKMQRAEDESGTIEFTYSHNKTLLTMKITQETCSGSVKALCIHLVEKSGKGSATLSLRVTENLRYGILCNYLKTKFVGSYDSDKDNYCWPPLLEREVVGYFCHESGSGGCFTLEKKKDEYGAVVRVKATHDFIVGEETMHVKVKIRYDDDERETGLNVEVEGPLKLTTEYMKHVVSRSERRMCGAIETSTLTVEPITPENPPRIQPSLQPSLRPGSLRPGSLRPSLRPTISRSERRMCGAIETSTLTVEPITPENPPRIQPSLRPGSLRPGSLRPGSLRPTISRSERRMCGAIETSTLTVEPITPENPPRIQPSLQPSLRPGSLRPGSLRPGSLRPGSIRPSLRPTMSIQPSDGGTLS